MKPILIVCAEAVDATSAKATTVAALKTFMSPPKVRGF
jgi:hypothetical protein